jgi:hypothetical protein
MNDRRGVTATAGVFDVVVDRMVIGGDRLKRRGVGVSKGPTGRPEDVPDPEILERPRFNDGESAWIELVHAGSGWLGHCRTPWIEVVRIGLSVAVEAAVCGETQPMPMTPRNYSSAAGNAPRRIRTG